MTMTLAWLTEEEALKHPTLAAIWQKPGISRVELAERGLVTLKPAPDGRDKLQTLVVSGKILPLNGGYYPYLPEYLPFANKKAPPLKVWRDPSVIGDEPTPAQAVAKAIATAVRSVTVNQETGLTEVEVKVTKPRATIEPVTPAEPEPEAIEVEAVEVVEPAPVKRRNSPRNPRQDKATLRNYQLIREIAASFERKGEPFTLNAVLTQAGITTGYLSKPCHQGLKAEVEAAVQRVAAMVGGQPMSLLSIPERTSVTRQKILDAIAQLEAEGKPFSRAQITSLAGVGSCYFARNHDAKRLADQAIARTLLKFTSEPVSEPQPTPQPEVTMPEPIRPSLQPSPQTQDVLAQLEADLLQEQQEITAELERLNLEIRQLEAAEKQLIQSQHRCDRRLKILQGGQP